MNARAVAVVGANFGDEGKGLAVDTFSTGGALVIRHNGGAQAGHTVEADGKRFVFHQLSAGSFRGADTLWAESFLPDLYKLPEELSDFFDMAGFVPRIFAEPGARITTVDDVLVNMAAETSRGKDRHGSCGMGVYEACLRSEAGFAVTVGNVVSGSAERLCQRLLAAREQYLPRRLAGLGLSLDEMGEYGELLQNKTVLRNFAEGLKRGAEQVIPAPDPKKLIAPRERVVFEGAQGLLLDAENAPYYPHVTASRTGLSHPETLSQRYGIGLDAAVYVLRGYVTRHGAGRLDCERPPAEIGAIERDRTNVENEWQGRLRYGIYPAPEALADAILSDAKTFQGRLLLYVTHLNETGGKVLFAHGSVPAEELCAHPAFRGRFAGAFLSASRYAEDTAYVPAAETPTGRAV